MTYVLYAAWFLSLLWLAGEVDRLLRRTWTKGFFAELAELGFWFLPPVVSAVLPGSGQLINRQPVKALLCLAWPLALGWLIPRPWQMAQVSTLALLIPWYCGVLADALVVGLLSRKPRAARLQLTRPPKAAAPKDEFTIFLERRRAAARRGEA